MLKKNKWTLLITSLVILLPTVAGLILWNRLPQEVAIHWGVSGEPDGWANKAVAVFALPAFLLALQWLCLFIALALLCVFGIFRDSGVRVEFIYQQY